MNELSHPAGVLARLEEIDDRLATVGNELEDAALAWFRKERDRKVEEAKAYVAATGNHSERRQAAVEAGANIGVDEQAQWEGKRQLLASLSSRSVVGTSILKAQGQR